MPSVAKKVVDDGDQIARELIDRGWEGLEAIEFAGYVLFPERLWKRKSNGKLEEHEIMMRVPRAHELRAARVKAREWAKRDGVDEEKDRVQFSDLEDLVIMWTCFRNPKAPHEPMWLSAEELERQFDKTTLEQAWSKLEHYRKMLDPRLTEVSVENVFAVASAITKVRNTGPLVVFDGPSQDSCVIIMASLLERYRTELSSQEQSERSTPEH